MGKIKRLIFSFLKVGLIGFGGGNALIPILEQVAVEKEKMVSGEAFEEDVVVASITPGALPVEIAGGIGRRVIGKKGLLIGSMSMALPGVILTVLLSSVISVLDTAVLLHIRYAAVGVTAFICCLLTEYIAAAGKQYKEGKLSKYGIVVTAVVFILTCGKNIYRILGLETKPLFSIATIHIFVVAFFLIFYMGESFSRVRFCVGACVSALYICCVGAAGIIAAGYVKYIVTAGMLFLGICGIIRTQKEERRESILFDRKRLCSTRAEIGFIALAAAVFAAAALCITRETAVYLGNGMLSSVMSFGGGDAYLTVADGLFVHTELISEGDFYNYLVPVVNVLPGSILCKTLSGIGYFIGYSAHGIVWQGILVALAGFFVSILASCGVFDIAGCFYGSFREMYFFRGIRRWIRPIVSGLMITVILSLVWQNMSLGQESVLGIKPLILMLLIYAADCFMVFRTKMNKGIIVFLSAVLSYIICLV